MLTSAYKRGIVRSAWVFSPCADPMNIRAAGLEDLEAMLRLYHDLHQDERIDLDEGWLSATWSEIVSDPAHTVFVVETAGVLAATCTLVVIRNLTRGGRPYAIIENVVTLREFRRRGFGSALLRHALSCAWAENCYKVMLLTGSDREETLGFYEKVGFVRGRKTGFVALPFGKG